MRKWTIRTNVQEDFTFLLFQSFSNQVLANALEPLRAANTFLGRQAYTWKLVTLDGCPVRSSAGMQIIPDAAFKAKQNSGTLILLPSYGYREIASRNFLRDLRSCATNFERIAGLDGGAWAMAAAGLLDGHRATIHFDEFDTFAETFPDVDAERLRWIDDGIRLTASGAVSAFEMMMHLISQAHGTSLTLRIASLFAAPDTTARGPLEPPQGDSRVRRAMAAMDANIERPLPIATLANSLGCNAKDLERRFQRAFGAPPRKVYQRIRLDFARNMVESSNLDMAEIAARCGYNNASSFARAFKQVFGVAPRTLRRC